MKRFIQAVLPFLLVLIVLAVAAVCAVRYGETAQQMIRAGIKLVVTP